MIRSLVDMITCLSNKCSVPVYRACSAMNVPRSSWNRWRSRTRAGLPLVHRPGPRKMQAADIAAINRDVSALDHGAKRSEGVTTLYARYRESVSRRDMAELVATARMDANRDARAHHRRIHWHGAGVVWAMDDTDYLYRDPDCTKSVVNQIQDLGAKYKLEPIGGSSQPCGEELAGHLDHLFHRYGASLFFKRDNGSNLNHSAVDEVFAEYGVLPLNSPSYYPPYNGAIENAQGGLKSEIDRQLAASQYRHPSLIEPYARAAAYELNHRARESLGGKTPCQVFFNQRVYFSKQKRKEIYDWIKSRQDYIINAEADIASMDVAWRLAAEVWLAQNGFITISINNKVLPNFHENLSHYL